MGINDLTPEEQAELDKDIKQQEEYWKNTTDEEHYKKLDESRITCKTKRTMNEEEIYHSLTGDSYNAVVCGQLVTNGTMKNDWKEVTCKECLKHKK